MKKPVEIGTKVELDYLTLKGVSKRPLVRVTEVHPGGYLGRGIEDSCDYAFTRCCVRKVWRKQKPSMSYEYTLGEFSTKNNPEFFAWIEANEGRRARVTVRLLPKEAT